MQKRLTHGAVFGDDFYQDASVIRISKVSLNLPAENQKAETLFIALIARASQPFKGVITGNGQVLTANGLPVTYDNQALYELLTLFFWRRNFTVSNAGLPIARHSFVLETFKPYTVNDDADDQQVNPIDLE
jgi:hypothetical protein